MAESEDQSAIMTPPDFTDLFEKQTAALADAAKASNACFEAIRSQDKILETLSSAYSAEIEQVFTIAKAVKNPPMAIASVPVVLTLANTTFAKAFTSLAELTALFEKAVAEIDLP
ncbi:hypothetical protein [Sneathiella glossodoripedis]|uniref:hypothetical protein n=1 Tax=Sneathiella glossodoripedis TaxID=418853 RepID=UPI00046EF570|nr:hypothetical protein [Sneathiella glossodoripedis]